METDRFLRGLTRGLSQTTSNLLAVSLGINISPVTTESYPASEWPDYSNQMCTDWYKNYRTSIYNSDSDSNSLSTNDNRSCMFFWDNNYLVNENSYKYYGETYVPKYSNLQNLEFKGFHSTDW